jgi:ABC-type polysaccharide/polyol phosphate export permease
VHLIHAFRAVLLFGTFPTQSDAIMIIAGIVGALLLGHAVFFHFQARFADEV